MSKRSGPLAEISWFQVVVSALAAVTAAWIASSLGVAGTLIGAALGSFVVTISSAFYGRTLDKGKTLIVQTASGTTVQKAVDEGEIAAAFEQVAEVDGSPVERAEIVQDGPRRLHWKTIVATSVIVLGVALAAMGAYEVVTGDSYGVHRDNPRIGNPLGGGSGSSSDGDGGAEESPAPTPTSTASTSSPTPDPTAATTPAPAATATTPAPTATPSPTTTATPTPTPTPKPSATTTAPPE